MRNWVIEPFRKNHERSVFDCGEPSLDAFIREHASQYEKRKISRTYVAVRGDSKIVHGYYALAAGSISWDKLPPSASRKLPKHDVPYALLGRLAVDRTMKGIGLGELLLFDALARALDASSKLGIHVVVAEAIGETAANFYRKYGFTSFADDALRLFLPLATVEASLMKKQAP